MAYTGMRILNGVGMIPKREMAKIVGPQLANMCDFYLASSVIGFDACGVIVQLVSNGTCVWTSHRMTIFDAVNTLLEHAGRPCAR